MSYGSVKLSDNLFKKVKENEKAESPGMKYKHYAPKTKCILVQTGINQISKINDNFISLGSKNNLQEISSNIFSSLRKVDRLNCDIAFIEGLEEKNLGLSIMNRLVRACQNNII